VEEGEGGGVGGELERRAIGSGPCFRYACFRARRRRSPARCRGHVSAFDAGPPEAMSATVMPYEYRDSATTPAREGFHCVPGDARISGWQVVRTTCSKRHDPDIVFS